MKTKVWSPPPPGTHLETTHIYIPLELITLILTWIHPRKSLQLQRLSKCFHNLLSSQSFALRNLRHFVPKSLRVETTHMTEWDHLFFHAPKKNAQIYARVYLPQIKSIQWGSCESRADSIPHVINRAIPTPLCHLPHLVHLNLSFCNLTGRIPCEIGFLVALEELNLENNQLDGGIPSSIGLVTNLKEVGLAMNRFTGCIPKEIGELKGLVYLSVSGNAGISGGIPVEWGNLSHLESLFASNTGLTGPIPVELGNLTNLVRLYLDGNNLSSHIPPSLGSLSRLKYVNLSDCNLVGRIPREFGGLVRLEYLYLNGNALEGEVPVELGALERLVDCDLGGNAGLTACEVQFRRGVVSI
ncbi:hypothetical protein HDU98_005525 [Podochytrium sp. JEL0797]|nr:hypothetical protein HDU98_005525 [Podochytrium sp. JEL0797]